MNKSLLVGLLFAPWLCWAQPKTPVPPVSPLSPVEGERQARALVAQLLAQKPTENFTNIQVLKLRGADKKWREIPITFIVLCSPTNFLNIYETAPSSSDYGGTRLTIIHAEDQPNQYFLTQLFSERPTNSPPRRLDESDLARPFGGSEFWIGDLGLEFLHWPQQRVLRKKMRKEQMCDVLQSTNPHPAAGGYSRVETWIAANHPDETIIVHADGYDAHGELLKAFDPTKVQKIHGAYQLEEMEMRNLQTGTRARIEFNLDSK